MKKTWMALLVFGALFSCSSPAEKGCAKMVSLCSEEAEETAKCAKDIEELDKALGNGVAQKFAECTNTATTCVQAVGCAAGASASGVGKATDEFLKGFQQGLGK